MIFKGFLFSDCAQNTSFGKNAFSNEIGISMYLLNFIFDRLRFFNFGAARVCKLWLSHWVVSMTVAARKTDGFHVIPGDVNLSLSICFHLLTVKHYCGLARI